MSSAPLQLQFIVVGAGMAGASIAAELAPHGPLVLLEAESQVGYHTTGRSAALFSEAYGNAVIRALTRASRSFLEQPPAGFAAAPLLRARDTLYLAGPGQRHLLAQFRADPALAAHTSLLSAEAVAARVGILRPDLQEGAVLHAGSADIDVDLLHQGFLRQARARGAQLRLDSAVRALRREGGDWVAHTDGGVYRAPVLVNAAGAWADAVATMAGARPLGLQPLRRTAALIDAPPGLDIAAWPAVIGVDESYYFKPDAGHLLISPADETPSPPCDAQPEELDVAIAVDRFETVTGLQVRQVRHRWAGLRVFSPDRRPVLGFDAELPGFFWCAGQGGYGIQTAPALGRAAAALALGRPLPPDLQALGVQACQLSPLRFIKEHRHEPAAASFA
ncbi:NAD(P)/FAD-dependent oxidoreductase [Roseateles violae]|uniref:FAD-binding oxidoreductase n=1 Tax=Roseateles violae TaxID=3058042 RepID=A0ABT8DVW2_9BURK|nr:FAD-binding oxidoreductase [Pelomonas sp. PFR6]MDN3922128.1 FAD-binding oxidoreductase [Pelomonas sp. PFR6]